MESPQRWCGAVLLGCLECIADASLGGDCDSGGVPRLPLLEDMPPELELDLGKAGG
jgi:hypothetical protein